MEFLKRAMKRVSEALGLLLIFGVIYKLFSSKSDLIEDIPQKLDDVSEPFTEELADSEAQYEEEVKEIENESNRIESLTGDDLASEFDSEFS